MRPMEITADEPAKSDCFRNERRDVLDGFFMHEYSCKDSFFFFKVFL